MSNCYHAEVTFHCHCVLMHQWRRRTRVRILRSESVSAYAHGQDDAGEEQKVRDLGSFLLLGIEGQRLPAQAPKCHMGLFSDGALYTSVARDVLLLEKNRCIVDGDIDRVGTKVAFRGETVTRALPPGLSSLP